jgi:ABC-type bacteriocin/lantibiotic exporter with double-glycine peptidase domain
MKKVTLHKQETDFSCGPASLKMVLGHFGLEKEERELIELTGAQAGLGCHPTTIVNAAKKLGFDAEYVDHSSLDEIKERMDKGEMIIVDWFSPEVNGHYSVVVEVTDGNITLANPTHGDYTVMTHSDFLNHWFELDEYPPKDPCKFYLREIVSIKKADERVAV